MLKKSELSFAKQLKLEHVACEVKPLSNAFIKMEKQRRIEAKRWFVLKHGRSVTEKEYLTANA